MAPNEMSTLYLHAVLHIVLSALFYLWLFCCRPSAFFKRNNHMNYGSCPEAYGLPAWRVRRGLRKSAGGRWVYIAGQPPSSRTAHQSVWVCDSVGRREREREMWRWTAAFDHVGVINYNSSITVNDLAVQNDSPPKWIKCFSSCTLARSIRTIFKRRMVGYYF